MQTSVAPPDVGTKPGTGMVRVTIAPDTAWALSASGPPRPERLVHTVDQSVRFYLDGDQQVPGWAYPRFLGLVGSSEDGIEVPLSRELWDRLTVEADRQEVPADALLQHAALYFAAARDAGRLTDRILSAIEAAESELTGDDRSGS